MPLAKSSSLVLQQRTIWFCGDVQGVGFRATTQRLASRLAVTGTVRNLSDGRVELIAEGTAAEINRLVAGLRDYFGAGTFDTEDKVLKATGSFPGFRIRH